MLMERLRIEDLAVQNDVRWKVVQLLRENMKKLPVEEEERLMAQKEEEALASAQAFPHLRRESPRGKRRAALKPPRLDLSRIGEGGWTAMTRPAGRSFAFSTKSRIAVQNPQSMHSDFARAHQWHDDSCFRPPSAARHQRLARSFAGCHASYPVHVEEGKKARRFKHMPWAAEPMATVDHPTEHKDNPGVGEYSLVKDDISVRFAKPVRPLGAPAANHAFSSSTARFHVEHSMVKKPQGRQTHSDLEPESALVDTGLPLLLMDATGNDLSCTATLSSLPLNLKPCPPEVFMIGTGPSRPRRLFYHKKDVQDHWQRHFGSETARF
ncbi:hypothetical protein CYMTET_43904 [Cymbomonas tetramitiformis]|uniref:Uncharacterized protein n=1 Tax=Cymbomonas tetramitiformis TaxID=36881 RepID=A0AAE0F177_9CHLO|nr:hypothetical protein CYMTET_43904 [Cymbomonas tetramitiformis]